MPGVNDSSRSSEDAQGKKRRRRGHRKKKEDTKPQESQEPKRQRRGGLQRAYGWFRCNECRKHWTSAWVFRVRGTQKIVFRQACKECDIFIFPFNNKCLYCGGQTCDCRPTRHDGSDSDEPFTVVKKPHEADYCEKCQSGWPCGSSKRRSSRASRNK